MFNGSYHGHADIVLGRSEASSAERRTVPQFTGIPQSALADVLVLDYGDPASLTVIEEFADEIAVVIVEAVQSRNPWVARRPKRLRTACDRGDALFGCYLAVVHECGDGCGARGRDDIHRAAPAGRNPRTAARA